MDDEMRLEMVRLALKNELRMRASDYEFGMPRPSYMWHTLQSMSADYPDKEFVLIIGADNWENFDRWYEWRKILDNYRIVVYPRTGSPIDAASLPANVTYVDTPLLDVSSTQIRRLIRDGLPFEHLVPFEVYIKLKNYFKLKD